MTVEMVGSEIQQQRDARAERRDPLELKAAQLGHYAGVVGGAVDDADQRRADVAREQRVQAVGFKDVRNQRRSGGFSVGAGDADQGSAFVQEARGQFDFAPDGDLRAARGGQQRCVGGHPGAGDHQFLLIKDRGVMRAKMQLHTCGAQLGGAGNFRFAAQIRGRHAGPARCAEKRRSHAGARQSDDQHALPSQLERYSHSFPYRLLAQFQRRQRKQCEHQRGDPETHDDFRFAPA